MSDGSSWPSNLHYHLLYLSLHPSLVYSDLWRHEGPYLIIRHGIGANRSAAMARIVSAHPYPTFSANGGTVKGKKAPMRQRVTRTAVIAEAEYFPNASVMNVIVGTMEKMTEMHRSVHVDRNPKTWTCVCAVHP